MFRYVRPSGEFGDSRQLSPPGISLGSPGFVPVLFFFCPLDFPWPQTLVTGELAVERYSHAR